MTKIRKKSSKRLGFREKYSVLKKVSAHHKKMRRTGKKLAKAGMQPRPGKNKTVIPNSFPGKEQLINEMEAQQKMEKEMEKTRINNLKQATKDFQNS